MPLARSTCNRNPADRAAGPNRQEWISMLTHVLIGDEGRTIELGWQDGTRSRFHAMWLRDNALDDKTRSAGTGQRLITILDIPAETLIGAASIKGDALEVSFVPEQKRVSFPASWLRANA